MVGRTGDVGLALVAEREDAPAGLFGVCGHCVDEAQLATRCGAMPASLPFHYVVFGVHGLVFGQGHPFHTLQLLRLGLHRGYVRMRGQDSLDMLGRPLPPPSFIPKVVQTTAGNNLAKVGEVMLRGHFLSSLSSSLGMHADHPVFSCIGN